MKLSKLKEVIKTKFIKVAKRCKSKLKEVGGGLLANIHSIIFILGLALLDGAAFLFGPILGLATAGSFFVLIAILLDKGASR
ncbi:hypothetical protein [Bacillus sp. mrc49]|uniref:hypothetical protein n=1 Tax=Bacillus sp. mrc49 TaxID=2054913 RepID=UPI000C272D11|nr:hypothetical protein [Bacillus sp. mrc49]PJN88204.1 hypothetical protein CVN76_21755 [Bacillus sp. mrc49]